MAETEEAKRQRREAYIDQALWHFERACHDIFDISQYPDHQDLEFDKDVMFETPIDNQIPIDVNDLQCLRKVFKGIYEVSGPLMLSPGGRDMKGNAWIKMQCRALTPIPGQYMILTEAILWILRPNLRPQDNPIEYAKYARTAAGISQSLPVSWVNLQHEMMPQQLGQ